MIMMTGNLIKGDYTASKYYHVQKKKPKCPFCGAKMEYFLEYSYESCYYYWFCKECSLTLEDREEFSEDYLITMMTAHRIKLEKEYRSLKEALEAVEQKLKKCKELSPSRRIIR